MSESTLTHIHPPTHNALELCLPSHRTLTTSQEKLLALPAAELAQLRGGSLGSHTAASIPKGASLGLFSSGQASTSFDLEAEIGLGPKSQPLQFEAALFAASPTSAEAPLF